MGLIALPATGVIYVDTNTVIYAVEQIEPYLTAAAPLWNAVNAGQRQVLTSELTLMETLVKPIKQGNQALVALFRNVLQSTAGISSVPIRTSILESAAELRARLNIRTPDAIHAATALETGCVLFVTNDAGFRRVPGLNVVVLGEVVAS